MLRKICLQAGHENAPNNCDPKLKSSTGAPGEVDFTVRVRNKLSDILLSKKNSDGSAAFTLQLVDSTYNCDPNADNTDYALFLALHYDAYINGSKGGFADFPEPSTDGATAESQRITKVINDVYFPTVGISYVNRSNANTRFYYMWKFLSAKTPCVLVECGTGQNPQEKPILADTERVATALARAICQAFSVPWEVAPPAVDYKVKYEQEVKEHTATKEAFGKYKQDAEVDKANAVKDALARLNERIDNAQKQQ